MDTASRIAFYLRNHNTATVEQLSFTLGLSKAAIHYHLRRMINRGSICVTPVPYQDGPGRPARQFILAKPTPKALSDTLVHFFITRELGQKIDKRTRFYLASRIAAYLLDSINLTGSPAVKLDMITRELSTLGIILRWQAGDRGPEMRITEEALSPLLQNNEFSQEILTALINEINQKIA